jgi:hypothetical protein
MNTAHAAAAFMLMVNIIKEKKGNEMKSALVKWYTSNLINTFVPEPVMGDFLIQDFSLLYEANKVVIIFLNHELAFSFYHLCPALCSHIYFHYSN